MQQSTNQNIQSDDSSVKLSHFKIPTPGAVKDHRSNYALTLWDLIVNMLGAKGTVKEPVLAEKVGCSTRLVRRILKGFERCHLISIESYNGQGQGIRIKNLWLEEADRIQKKLSWKRAYQKEREYLKSRNSRKHQNGRNPLDYLGIPDGVLTKGSRPTKYLMYKTRKFLENSHLSQHASTICGKIFNYLEGKTASKGIKWLSRLKTALKVDWSLTDFFVWFAKLVESERKERVRREKSKKRRNERKKKKKKARKSFEENSPPRSKNFDSMADYVEAFKKWDEGKD